MYTKYILTKHINNYTIILQDHLECSPFRALYTFMPAFKLKALIFNMEFVLGAKITQHFPTNQNTECSRVTYVILWMYVVHIHMYSN